MNKFPDFLYLFTCDALDMQYHAVPGVFDQTTHDLLSIVRVIVRLSHMRKTIIISRIMFMCVG